MLGNQQSTGFWFVSNLTFWPFCMWVDPNFLLYAMWYYSRLGSGETKRKYIIYLSGKYWTSSWRTLIPTVLSYLFFYFYFSGTVQKDILEPRWYIVQESEHERSKVSRQMIIIELRMVLCTVPLLEERCYPKIGLWWQGLFRFAIFIRREKKWVIVV